MNLRPIHGLYRSRPASASQFFIYQSSLSYKPGQNVTVEIATDSADRNFRGFIVQAYDPINGPQIGHFEATADSQPVSCSGTTHRNNSDKKRVSLTWCAPSQSETASAGAKPLIRQVRFRGTIVVTYDEFYTGFESSELSFDKFDYSDLARGLMAANSTLSPALATTS